jgi:ketosteroid isomerase-like protein
MNAVIYAGTALLFAATVTIIGACSEYSSPETQAMKEQLTKYKVQKAATDRSLDEFDSMDFDGISRQRWDLFNSVHAEDVVVNWPNGHSTKGIAAHAEEARALLAFAPDAWVEAHPVRFGSGEWTCVTGTIVGTFSKTMTIEGGKNIPPTGKRFRIPMCTVARWKDGKIVEKSLYWDNQTLTNQLGLAGYRP